MKIILIIYLIIITLSSNAQDRIYIEMITEETCDRYLKQHEPLTVNSLIELYDEYSIECYNDSTLLNYSLMYFADSAFSVPHYYHNNIPNGLDAKFMNWLKNKKK